MINGDQFGPFLQQRMKPTVHYVHRLPVPCGRKNEDICCMEGTKILNITSLKNEKNHTRTYLLAAKQVKKQKKKKMARTRA